MLLTAWWRPRPPAPPGPAPCRVDQLEFVGRCQLGQRLRRQFLQALAVHGAGAPGVEVGWGLRDRGPGAPSGAWRDTRTSGCGMGTGMRRERAGCAAVARIPRGTSTRGCMQGESGRSDRIRTYDPLVPNQMRYQTALRSDGRILRGHDQGPALRAQAARPDAGMASQGAVARPDQVTGAGNGVLHP
jgi:hypothetical protein